MSKTLESLKAELKQLKEILAMDLSNWDVRTKVGMVGRQTAAAVRIEEVKNDLGYFILKNSAAVLLMRDYEETGAVIESAKKNPDANIVIDALMLEKKLFRQLFNEKAPAFTFNTQIVNHINVLMSEIGQKIGAAEMQIVQGDGKYYGTLRTREEMISRLELVLYTTYGDELKGHFFRSIIMDEINRRTHRDAVNIVIANVVPNTVRAFSSFAGSTQVLANEAPGSQLVKKTPAPRKAQSLTGSTVQPKAALTPAIIQQIGVKPEELTGGPTTAMEVLGKKAYTGARRGRKTNAERAALVAASGTDTGTSQNEG